MDTSSAATAPANGPSPSPVDVVQAWTSNPTRRYLHVLDKSTPHGLRRWLGTLAVALIYVLHFHLVEGFYVVSYGLGIYLLNLLIGFLSPQVDPEMISATDFYDLRSQLGFKN